MVGIADSFSLMMWTKNFMETQGYSIGSNILFQDNHSNILIAKNGRSSVGKKSKNINNHYLLISDKVHQEDLEICYYPTGEIPADYQSNTQQGKLFYTMRAQLMNRLIDYNDDKDSRKLHPLLLPRIEAGSKGEELKKNIVGDGMKSNKTALKNKTDS